jgi:hypothetical protein
MTLSVGASACGRGRRRVRGITPFVIAVLAFVPALVGARLAFGMLTRAGSTSVEPKRGVGAFVGTGEAVVGLRRLKVVDVRRGGLLDGPRSNTVVVEAGVSLVNVRGSTFRYSLSQFRLGLGGDGSEIAAGGPTPHRLAPYSRTDIDLRFVVRRPDAALRLVYAFRPGRTIAFDVAPSRVKGGTPHVHSSP